MSRRKRSSPVSWIWMPKVCIRNANRFREESFAFWSGNWFDFCMGYNMWSNGTDAPSSTIRRMMAGKYFVPEYPNLVKTSFIVLKLDREKEYERVYFSWAQWYLKTMENFENIFVCISDTDGKKKSEFEIKVMFWCYHLLLSETGLGILQHLIWSSLWQ